MPFHKQSLARIAESPIGELGSRLGTFVKENPLLTGVGLAASVGGITAVTRVVKRRRKAKRKSTRRRSKVTKSRSRRTSRRGRRIIRGRGLGRGEIRHSGKGTRGTKVVRFRTKQGKMVSFKVKGTSKRRKGFRKRRRR